MQAAFCLSAAQGRRYDGQKPDETACNKCMQKNKETV
jgi:hypothetical protein